MELEDLSHESKKGQAGQSILWRSRLRSFSDFISGRSHFLPECVPPVVLASETPTGWAFLDYSGSPVGREAHSARSPCWHRPMST